MICRICGEEKEKRAFYRLSTFVQMKKRRIWCRDCQRLWLAKEREKEEKKEFTERVAFFIVSFR